MRPIADSRARSQNRALRFVSPKRSLRTKSLKILTSPSCTQPRRSVVRQLSAFPWNSSPSSARRSMMLRICSIAGPTVSTPPARSASQRSKSRSGCTEPMCTRGGGSTGAAMPAGQAAPCEPSSLTLSSSSSSFSAFFTEVSTLMRLVSTSPRPQCRFFSRMASRQKRFARLPPLPAFSTLCRPKAAPNRSARPGARRRSATGGGLSSAQTSAPGGGTLAAGSSARRVRKL
mmetsp:Transcript_19579/g.59000  ORF Transcript_19579/g.59000 Transcript_19579/m.59000 type:complete len:231 (+) Transcript_19579:302-994(+)